MNENADLVYAVLIGGGLVVSLALAGAAFAVARARGVRPAETGLWRASVIAAGVAMGSFFLLPLVMRGLR